MSKVKGPPTRYVGSREGPAVHCKRPSIALATFCKQASAAFHIPLLRLPQTLLPLLELPRTLPAAGTQPQLMCVQGGELTGMHVQGWQLASSGHANRTTRRKVNAKARACMHGSQQKAC